MTRDLQPLSASSVPKQVLVTSVAVFLFVFVTHVLSPNATPFDSRWTIHTAYSLVRNGDLDLNEFSSALRDNDYYAIECVDTEYRRTFPINPAAPCPNGRFLNFYPLAVPMMAAPVVFVLDTALDALQPWLSPLADSMATATRRAFLKGDLVGASMLTELIAASSIIALASVVIISSAVRC
jgi:hypothetical protein